MVVKYDLPNLMLQNSISKFRVNPAYIKCCEAHAVGLGSIQDAIDYMSNCLNVDIATGIWLDYIGWLVGTTRKNFDISKYFCVNAPDINVEQEFFFPTETNWTQGSLNDTIFRQRIKAKIGYNISKGTREENLFIIKNLTNADNVIITKEEVLLLNVHLYGDNIIFSNINSLRSDIQNIFGVTVGLNNLEIN